MKHFLLILAAGLLAAGAGIGTSRVLRSRPDTRVRQAEPPHRVSVRSLDFGEVWETDQFVWQVRVDNPGPETARVTPLAASCGCAATGSVPVVIPAGETREVSFEVDLRGGCAQSGPREYRDVELPLTVAVEPAAAAPTRPWVLRGRVRTALSLPSSTVDLGRTPASSSANPPSRVIPVRVLTDLSRLTVSVDHPAVTAVLRQTPDPRAWELAVSRAAGLPIGKHTATVRLHPVPTSGGPAPPIRLPVEFEMLSDIQPDSPVVVCDARRVGGVAEGHVALASLSGRPFRVTGWATEPANAVEVALDGKPPRGQQSLTLRHKVAAAGDNIARLRVRGLDTDEHPFEVVVEVRSFGTSSE